MKQGGQKKKIALWFRYGVAEQPLFQPAIVAIADRLSTEFEMCHYGPRSDLQPTRELREKYCIHLLPFKVRRKSTFDKFVKCGVWLCCLPFIGLACRFSGVQAVWIDETVPLTALLARVFFGRNVALTVHDSFVDIYLIPHRLLRPLGRLLKWIDISVWKRLPLILTRVEATTRHLRSLGFQQRILTTYDTCDLSVFRPIPDRQAARERFGFSTENVVLVHHGVLHPNKGNDRILRAIPAILEKHPNFRFLLIGDGPEKDRLMQLTRDLKIGDAVRFAGFLDSLDDLNLALNAGDISVTMRIGQETDNFHVTSTLVHNAACGLPLLVARLAGMSEVVKDGENGFLFDPRDMTEFKEKLSRLIDDPTLRADYAGKALETARRLFDINRVAGILSDALRDLAASDQ